MSIRAKISIKIRKRVEKMVEILIFNPHEISSRGQSEEKVSHYRDNNCVILIL